MTNNISKSYLFYDENNVKTSSELVSMLTSGLMHGLTFKPTKETIDFTSSWLYRVSCDRRLYNFFPPNIRIAFPVLEMLHEMDEKEVRHNLHGAMASRRWENPDPTNPWTHSEKLKAQHKAAVGAALFSDAELYEAGYTNSVKYGDEYNEPLDVEEHMGVILTATLFIISAQFVQMDMKTGRNVTESVTSDFRYALPSVHKNVSGRTETVDMAMAMLAKQAKQAGIALDKNHTSCNSDDKHKSSLKKELRCFFTD